MLAITTRPPFSQNIVRKIEAVATGSQDKPQQEVTIYDCGSVEVASPYGVAKAAADEWSLYFHIAPPPTHLSSFTSLYSLSISPEYTSIYQYAVSTHGAV